MTKKQPEALRLADLIESDFDPDWMHEDGYYQIAAELRRLHQENVVLNCCLFQMQEAAKGQGLTAAKAQGDNND